MSESTQEGSNPSSGLTEATQLSLKTQFSWPKFEQLGIGFAISTAIFAALMYFTGVQFFDAKAQTLGLAAHSSDLSFQEFVATGFGVFFTSSYVLLLLIALGFAYISAAALGLLRMFLKVARNPQELLRKTSKVKIRMLAAFCLLFASLIPLGLIVSAWIFLLTGRAAGYESARSVIAEVSTNCSNCMVYRSKDRKAVGIAALQTNDVLFVATRSGLVTFPLSEPVEVSWPSGFAKRIKETRDVLSVQGE